MFVHYLVKFYESQNCDKIV